MIYILNKNFIFSKDFLNELKDEFLKGMTINIFYHSDDEKIINKFLISSKLDNKLIRTYKHNFEGGFKRIDIKTSIEELGFLKNINEFNYPQYIASNHSKDINLLINAGAGTGKTTTTIETILNLLLSKECELEDILVTTFTNNAADDIYEKIYNELMIRWELTGNLRILDLLENINNLKICTLHKYFLTLLGELGGWYGYSNNVSICSLNERLKKFIEDIIKNKFEKSKLSEDEYGVYLVDLTKIIRDIVTNEKIDISRIKDFNIDNLDYDQRIKNLVDLLILVCEKISNELFEELVDNDKVMMSDINYKLSSMFLYNADFEEKITKYKYIFIDECQDTSDIQFEIIRNVLELTGGKLFAVGDNLQAIYRFRNADPKSMDNFQEISDLDLNLVENYRTKKEILEEINSTFKNLKGNDYKELSSNKLGGMKIKKIKSNYDNKYYQLARIVKNELSQIEEKRKIYKNNKENRIAILVRNNYEANKVFKELRDKKISCDLERGGSLYQSDAARDLLNLVRYILYPKNRIYRLQLLETGYCDFDIGIDSKTLVTEYNLKLIDDLKFSINKCISDNKTALTILTDIIYDSSFSNNNEYYEKDLNIITEDLINKGCTTFSEIEDFLVVSMNADKETKSSEELNAESKVVISTFHSTKGLEFDTVILLTDNKYDKNFVEQDTDSNKIVDLIIDNNNIGICYKNHTKSKFIKNNNYEINKEKELIKIEDDEINLLYVAMTRAKNNLYIVYDRYLKDGTHGALLKRANLLGE
ncbi:UvrD-helicase domain-containing protein [Clostridium perfringens]|uniref:UvrD-helicase domain-containing protein n=1 Tax=Clostridium perfringens TaxID=1502 RepID=UPI00321C1F24